MTSKFIPLLLALVGLTTISLTNTSCTTDLSASQMPKSKVGGGRVNRALLSQGTRSNTKVVVDIADQKAFLLVNGKIAVRTPVSTARPGKRTPRGSFSISEKVRSGKISTIYNVSMPYWMRLSGTPFGMHAGYLPGYPASAGCIRMPSNMAKVFYDNTYHGTRVTIYSSWSGN